MKKEMKRKVEYTQNKIDELKKRYDDAVRTLARRATEYGNEKDIPIRRYRDIESDLSVVQRRAEEIHNLQIELACFTDALYLAEQGES